MPVTVTVEATLITIRFQGLLVPEDAFAVVDAFDELPHNDGIRKPLLVDATDTFVSYFPWTEERRRVLGDVCAQVGPIGIAAATESARAAAKNALDPLSTLVVWRVFKTPEETKQWLTVVARHGRSMWTPTPANPSSIELARLLHASSIRRAPA